MFVRRLIVLAVAAALGAGVLGLRLGQMQLAHAPHWESQARLFVNRHYIIETHRGTIRDRQGRPVAQDRPCYDLAMDYRAMNLDDRWITQLAVRRLKAQGVADRRERLRRLPAAKAQIADQIEAIPETLARACGVPVEEIKQRCEEIRARIQALRQNCARQYDRDTDAQETGLADADLDQELADERVAHTLIDPAPDTAVFDLDKVLDQYPGLVKLDTTRRTYPYDDVAAQVIGVLRPVDRETLLRRRFDRPNPDDDEPSDLGGYLPGDVMGATGIERAAEGTLRGSRGVRLVEVGGQEILAKHVEPVYGRDVTLTLDIELQRDLQKQVLDPARRLLKGQDDQDHNVAVVVLGLDGQVLLMLSTPTYNLNEYDRTIGAMLQDRVNRPLVNRALASYPPGSTVKPMVAAAALTDVRVTPAEQILCRGYLYPNNPRMFRCSIFVDHGVGHDLLDMQGALERSCNIYFYTMGQRLGFERLRQWYQAFGFGLPTGLGLAGEDRGALPPASLAQDPDSARREATQMGIGQGGLSTTPLQVAAAYATLLRGGARIQPRLILDEKKPDIPPIALAPATVQTVFGGMRAVVAGEHGTAHRLLEDLKLPLAGKTGSATSSRRVYRPDGSSEVVEGTDAWFVGVAPANRPQFVIVALKEFGGHGGATAVPLVKETVLQMEKHGYLPAVDAPGR